MDFYGYSIWTEVISGDVQWMNALQLGDPKDLDMEGDAWDIIFRGLKDNLQKIGFSKPVGGVLHFSSRIPQFLQNPMFESYPKYQTARQNFIKESPLEIGMHSTFGEGEHVTEGKFTEILTQDLIWAQCLGATAIVEHFPKQNPQPTKAIIAELTSPTILKLLHQTPIILAWENGGPKDAGNLQWMVDFRNQLIDKLTEIGEKQLIDLHQFCLDTGHLLNWRHAQHFKQSAAQKIIDTALPLLAKNLKVFHIHANDSTGDQHLIPGSLKFFDQPNRKHINQKKFLKYSEEVLEWIKICNRYAGLDHRHIHVESLRLPFDYGQLIEFGKKVNSTWTS